jgi:hypothetical protein
MKQIELGSCFVRSWNLYKSEFGLIFFTTLVITIAAGAASGFPYIGPVIGMLLNGVLYGGLYFFYLKLIRGQKAELPDAFEGFKTSLGPLILAGLVTNVLIVAAFMIAALPSLFTVVPVLIRYAENPEMAPDILLTALGIGSVLNLVFCILVVLALYLLWIFAFPLIMDRRMDFWPAMEASRKTVMANLGTMTGLLLVGILLGLIGVLACCIGIFFTLPIFYGAVAYAYEDLFGS